MYDVLALRRANPIADVVEDAGVQLRRVGSRFIGRCPLHSDAEPSLVVYPTTESYFCFGCQAGGDVIDFLSRLHGFGFRQAAAMLTTFEATPREPRRLPRPEGGRCAANSREEPVVVQAAVLSLHAALWRSPRALAYLAGRGIERETAFACRLGFGHPDLADELRLRGVSTGAARRLGLLHGERNAFLGRIVIPDLVDGKAVWLTGRRIAGDGPRYLNLRTPSPLLGLSRVDGDEVVVTEGPFDWLTALQWGLPAVALAGSRASRHALQTLGRFRRVYLVLDNDVAGERAAGELAEALGERACVVRLPNGVKDLNELACLPGGEQLFRERLQESRSRKEGALWSSGVFAALPSAA